MSSRYLNAWHGKNFQTGEICWQGRWSTKHGAVSWAGSCVYAAKAVAEMAGTLITQNTRQEGRWAEVRSGWRSTPLTPITPSSLTWSMLLYRLQCQLESCNLQWQIIPQHLSLQLHHLILIFLHFFLHHQNHLYISHIFLFLSCSNHPHMSIS